MAFRPSLRSIWTLVAMAAVCYGLYLWAEYSRVDVRRDNYDLKLAAATKMNAALKALADRGGDGETLETYGDPRLDVMIGQQFSTITIDIGSFEEKMAGVNPNLAAVAVEMLLEAGVKSGDQVAVALTGSDPGANLAVLSACEAMGVRAYTITALSSTWWGASDPNDTWTDMQTFLTKNGILSATQVAVSLGGLDDNALGLSGTGRAELAAAAARNSVKLLESTGSQAAATWWGAFKTASGNRSYAAYVNVGEGVASLGHKENGGLIADGVYHTLPLRNWPARGVIHLAAQEGVSIVHIYSAAKLARDYGLGATRIPISEPGSGDVFVTSKYDMRVAVTALALALAALFVLVWFDAKYFRLADAGVDPETLL